MSSTSLTCLEVVVLASTWLSVAASCSLGQGVSRQAGLSRPDVSLADAVPLPDAAGPDGRAAGDAGVSICDGVTGLREPISVCSASHPCQDGVWFEDGRLRQGTITVPTFRAHCRSPDGSLNDGPAWTWIDPFGVERTACLFVPGGEGPWPLVIFLHGGGGGAETVYRNTGLREKAETFLLRRGVGPPGFVLVSVQGRNLDSPFHRPAPSFDWFYRQADNPDFQFLDRLIDGLVSEGVADARQVYIVGWSAGGYFAQLYGLLEGRTADGVPVAAVAAYGASTPFGGLRPDPEPSCAMLRLPVPRTPLWLAVRACDAFSPCSAAQAEAFESVGHPVEPWVEELRNLGAAALEFVVIGNDGACLPVGPDCTERIGTISHLTWPEELENELLTFFREHPSDTR